MTDISSLSASLPETTIGELNARRLTQSQQEDPELKAQFLKFAGQTFFGQMLASMRKTQEKPAYFHGGKGEEVFQAQMDQTLALKMSEKSADQFAGPMWELMNLQRR